MSQLTAAFTSTIGRKFVMALTGLFLISFLIVHCGINTLIFFNDNGERFNLAAHFMGSNLIIRTMEIGLFAGLLLHIVQGLLLWSKNRRARPAKYATYKSQHTRPWYSSSMGILGSLILIFLVVHLANFWVPSRFTGLPPVFINGKEYHNLYFEMIEHFKNPFLVLIYLVGVAALYFHLVHGFQSAFQTFGLNNGKYAPLISRIGLGYSILVCLLFAAMPLSIFLGLIK